MNLITFWRYGTNNSSFKNLIESLNVKYCAYLYTEEKDSSPIIEGVECEGIYYYQDPTFILHFDSAKAPVDEELVIKMQPFQQTMMDILFRWRKSISTKEDYATIKALYYKYLIYFNHFIEERSIDICVFTAIPHTPIMYIIYALCKVKKIKYYNSDFMPFISSQIRQREYWSSEIGSFGCEFDKYYKKIKEENEIQFICDNRLHELSQAYFAEYKKKNNQIGRVIVLTEKKGLIKRSREILCRSKLYLTQKRYNILFKKFLELQKIRFYDSCILKVAEKYEEKPDFSETYVLLLLHYQPEATTLPRGGMFVDQLFAIDILSKCMPEGVMLYVKEHPAFWKVQSKNRSMADVRNRSFYRHINNIRNVKMIHHDFSSLELIDHCIALSTITGTAGWEAIFKNKPVLMFGDFFYSKAPGVYNIRNLEDCNAAYDKIFACEEKMLDTKEMQLFLAAVDFFSYDIYVPDLESNDFSEYEYEHYREEDNGKNAVRKLKEVITFFREESELDIHD